MFWRLFIVNYFCRSTRTYPLDLIGPRCSLTISDPIRITLANPSHSWNWECGWLSLKYRGTRRMCGHLSKSQGWKGKWILGRQRKCPHHICRVGDWFYSRRFQACLCLKSPPGPEVTYMWNVMNSKGIVRVAEKGSGSPGKEEAGATSLDEPPHKRIKVLWDPSAKALAVCDRNPGERRVWVETERDPLMISWGNSPVWQWIRSASFPLASTCPPQLQIHGKAWWLWNWKATSGRSR